MSFFTTEERGEALLITLNRPPVNALGSEVLEEGIELFRRTASHVPDGGVVLTGSGKAFSAGADTKEIAANEKDYLQRQRLVRAINRFSGTLYRMPCAVVSAVNGHAIGLGGIICLASDWVVAVDNEEAQIGLTEAKAGMPFPAVPQTILEYALDPVWRRRLALTSLIYTMREAIVFGLVDEVAEADKLTDVALERVRELSEQPGFRPIKANLRRRAQKEIDAFLME